jgi:hypothetical protein
MKIIFGQRDNKMSGMPIFAQKFDPLKFKPFQQSVSSGKSGLAPKNCLTCNGVDELGSGYRLNLNPF